MFAFFRTVVEVAAPLFVISAMLNVGLTQKLSEVVAHLKDHSFVLRMLLANFVLAPLLMIAALTFTSFDPAVRDGLLIFSLAAGAPFLIKLTQTADHSIALGAAVMILLIATTAIYVPIVLPLVMFGVAVDGLVIAKTLAVQMLLPIAMGMLAVRFLPRSMRTIQPFVGKLANITLYVLLAATLIGYFPNMMAIAGSGAILLGLLFVGAAFGIGYWMGRGKDHLEDVGGLGTAQRNTAAGVLIATQNFDDPNVLVILAITNALGIVMLLLIAKRLSRDN
ncbi:MAG TPA: sodium:proton symporter, partial [Thermoanaerobaculia bacterium]|nr:sodium:proton symporter [Thermoanaerobaculia bacterium]